MESINVSEKCSASNGLDVSRRACSLTQKRWNSKSSMNASMPGSSMVIFSIRSMTYETTKGYKEN